MGRFRFLPPLIALLREHATDLLAVAGVACVFTGVRGWSVPASWIVLGAILLAAWWRLERTA